ncbi:MAG: HugZ family protein [Pseudomonadota bacterium]
MSNAQEARQMLRAHRYGALSTLSKKFDGHPFGSITPYLTDHDGSLLILISTIAEHTKNIQNDPRVSLITHNQQDAQIQTQGRVTALGKAQPVADKEESSRRYLRYFPEAAAYFAMHDFSFYRIRPDAIRYIGGFGQIHWITAESYAVPSYPLIGQEESVITHMNADHRHTMQQYCRQLHQYQADNVEMLGIDCDGFDLSADGKILRFNFTGTVLDAQQARQALVAMARATATD